MFGLIDQYGRAVAVKSQAVRSGSKALRLPIPMEFLKKFDVKSGHKFNVIINEAGAIMYQPIDKVKKVGEE